MTEDIKKKMQSIAGMGERIRIISTEIKSKATEMEDLARIHDRLTQTRGISRAEIKFFTGGSYERAAISFTVTKDGINDYKSWLIEKIRKDIEDLLVEVERLKEKI